jgi:hypothetical protein
MMVLGFSIKRDDLRVVVGSASAVSASVTHVGLGASGIATFLSRIGPLLRGAMLVDLVRCSKRVCRVEREVSVQNMLGR